jgi:hypothetical protein
MRRIGLLLKILFISLLSTLLGLVITILCGTAQNQWKLAKDIAPPELLKQIAQENFQPGKAVEVEQMKIWKIENSLYLIDTRIVDDAKEPQTNLLCGKEDCLFLGYVLKGERYQRVLDLYVNPRLPPKIPLWHVLPQLSNGLPCLVIRQLIHHQIQAAKLCFNGTSYEVVASQLLPERYE